MNQEKKERTPNEMRSDYLSSLKDLRKFYIRKKILFGKDYPFTVPTKRQILLSSSLLKIQVLGQDLLSVVEEGRFFTAMGTLRMMFEELMALTFVLRELQSAKTTKKIEKILDKAIVGRRSGKKEGHLMPHHIAEVERISESYLKDTYPQLAGMYTDTYAFISEHVHPNGPSRFYFWHKDKAAIYFHTSPPNEDDKRMILTHGCMALDMYKLIHSTLKKVILPE